MSQPETRPTYDGLQNNAIRALEFAEGMDATTTLVTITGVAQGWALLAIAEAIREA